MKLLMPTTTWGISDNSIYYWDVPGVPLQYGGASVPLYSRYCEWVEVENVFLESGKGRENFVHHRKPVGQTDITVFRSNKTFHGKPVMVYPRMFGYEQVDGDIRSDVYGWVAIPGYTVWIACWPSDRSGGYASSYTIKCGYAQCAYNPTMGGRYRVISLTRKSNGTTTGGDSSRLSDYLKAIAEGISPWRRGDIGNNNNAAGRLKERAWSVDQARRFYSHIDTIQSMGIELAKGFTSWTKSGLFSISPAGLPTPPNTLLNEEYLSEAGVISRQPNQEYFVQLAKQHTFLEACEATPVMSDNNISNVLEVTSFIYNLVVRHKIEMPDSLASAWLSYRYQYSTTKMDVEEAIHFMDRHVDDNMWKTGLKEYGMYEFNYGSTSIQARCKVVMAKRELSKVQEVWDKLRTYGLTPDFYVLWDMLPYSFIVDWFVPVGDVLNVVDASREYTEEHYDFKAIVYSLKYEIQDDLGITWSVYTRWPEESPPSLSGLYWLGDNAASEKTLIKRFIDAASLVVSR